MEKQQFDELVKQVGDQTATRIKSELEAAEKRINEKSEETQKGLMTAKAFEDFKAEQIKGINEKMGEIEKASKTQGEKINELLEKGKAGSKSFEQFIIEQKDALLEMRKKGTMVEFTGSQLKVAGITSVGGSVSPQSNVPTSPYAPGIGGTELELFDIMRNPNYITNRVDLGRTDTFRLAWINETDYQGTPAQVLESGSKPLTQHKFQVELSQAKKIAAYIQLTEEFDQDLPGLATAVRRMLQQDVIRAWDDAIQTDVINAAKPFNLTQFTGKVADATQYDAIGAFLAQIGYNNFIANGIELNPITLWRLFMEKDSQGRYLLPPFMDRINPLIGEANKAAVGFALVGDFKQYKVDIYKDFVLKMGWINDDLIKNQFCIVGELRYHSYISDARKSALVYDQVQYTANKINGTPTS